MFLYNSKLKERKWLFLHTAGGIGPMRLGERRRAFLGVILTETG